MASSIANDDITSDDSMRTPYLGLPDASWDEGRLLDYMTRLDQNIGSLERKTLEDEFYYGAACDTLYERLGGRWTKWADEHDIPRETFRRRRLVFLRTNKDVSNLANYASKMECYWDLGIYRRPQDARPEVGRGAQEVDAPEGREGRSQAPLRGERADDAKPQLRTTSEAGETSERGGRAGGDGGPELVDEIEESRSEDPEREVTIRLMASTIALIELLGEQEGCDAGALVCAAVRDYAAKHLQCKTWGKNRLGKSHRPALAQVAG